MYSLVLEYRELYPLISWIRQSNYVRSKYQIFHCLQNCTSARWILWCWKQGQILTHSNWNTRIVVNYWVLVVGLNLLTELIFVEKWPSSGALFSIFLVFMLIRHPSFHHPCLYFILNTDGCSCFLLSVWLLWKIQIRIHDYELSTVFLDCVVL